MSEQIASNLATIQKKMADAAQRAGRQTNSVQLVAVTKHRSIAETQAITQQGHRILGENRMQELLQKLKEWPHNEGETKPLWHFIGHLQSKKARQIVGNVDLLHAVDSLKLAQSLQRAAENKQTRINILLQVNISGEQSKYGLQPRDTQAAIAALADLDRVHCQGLMTMAPRFDNIKDTRPVFRELRILRDNLMQKDHQHVKWKHLSMGMSRDFEIAIEEGATLIRVGSALFE